MSFCFNDELNCSEVGSLLFMPSHFMFLSLRKLDILFSAFDSVLSGFNM